MRELYAPRLPWRSSTRETMEPGTFVARAPFAPVAIEARPLQNGLTCATRARQHLSRTACRHATAAILKTVQYVAVAVGARLGANVRFSVGHWAPDRFGAEFPYGTFIINVTSAFAIGIVLSSAHIGERVGVDPLLAPVLRHGLSGRLHDVFDIRLGDAHAGPVGQLAARPGLRLRQQRDRLCRRVARLSPGPRRTALKPRATRPPARAPATSRLRLGKTAL